MSFLVILLINLLSFNSQYSLPKAETESTQLSATVLYVFTGSDWCPDCKRFKNTVLSDSIFINSMKRNNIEVEIIDFPQRKKLSLEVIKHNEAIAEAYDFQGIFPTLVLSKSINKYDTLSYENEAADEFSEIILNKLKYLDE